MSSRIGRSYECSDPACKSKSVVEDSQYGQLVCRDCGLVLKQKLVSEEAEWRTFKDEEDDPSGHRASGATDMHDAAFTDPRFNWRAPSGNAAGNDGTRPPPGRTLNEREKKILSEGFSDIQNMLRTEGVELKVIHDRARYFYSFLRNLKRGRQDPECRVAAMYTALREGHQTMRTVKEAISLSSMVVNKNLVMEFCKNLQDQLGVRVENMKPEALIPRYMSQLNLPPSFEQDVIFIARAGLNGPAKGKSPVTLCATALHMFCDVYPDKKYERKISEIASITGVSQQTIKSCYREMMPYAEQVIPTSLKVLSKQSRPGP